ncbi:MAG: hypothetical protein ACI97A_000915 [Planctomycetota bacterium]|jgi:hypothetical protein
MAVRDRRLYRFGGPRQWLRVSYCGQSLPNPYYVKSKNHIFGPISVMLPRLKVVSEYLILRLIPTILILIAAAKLMKASRRVSMAIFCIIAPALAVTTAYILAIHENAGSFRYEYPLWIPVISCFALALANLAKLRRGAFIGVAFAVSLAPALGMDAATNAIHWLDAPRSFSTVSIDIRPQKGALQSMG